LNWLGIDLGPAEHLLPPRKDNPNGYWEHRVIVGLNDKILSTFDGSWDSPPQFLSGWQSDQKLADVQRRARSLIQEDFASADVLGWKDPRACLTLPFWQEFLPPMRYIICLRNPLDVARSLAQRDGMAIGRGSMLWDY
jgi:hypothetical protein